jgi:DNA polymerase elongation subunit (family B)
MDVPTKVALQYNQRLLNVPETKAGASERAGFIDAPEINAHIERFIKNRLPSIVGYDSKGFPFIEYGSHIDLYRVFRNTIIRTSVFNNGYRSLRLNDVATKLIGKGKFEGIVGQNVSTSSMELQREYVLRDAELVMDLSKSNNCQVLQLMQAIAQLTGLSLEQVCHSTISTWWSKVFVDMGFAPG